MKRYLAPLGIAALLLSGCSAENDAAEPSQEPTMATSTPSETADAAMAEGDSLGSYTFESGDGAVGTLEVPGVAPADIEELRAAGGGETVAYLTGNLDNRNGSESFDVYTISVYDMDGNEYNYEPADDYLGNFPPADTSADAYNPYLELKDKYGTVVDSMQRADFVMVGPVLPEQIAGVSVSNGFDNFGATPAG